MNAAPPGGVRLAGPGDDAALRCLLRRAVVPGVVRVAFTREPSYASGDGAAGSEDFTVLATRDGRPAGMGRCSVQTLHRNGTPRRLGYLAELRWDPAFGGSARALRDGYRLLTESAARAGVEGFFTSITDSNARARRVLEHGTRLGLPAYRPICRLVTLLAPVPRHAARAARAAGSTDAADAGELTGFLARTARDAQLTLAWDAARWTALAAHGIAPGDFSVVRRGGRIVAAAAVWDQRAFRQTVIDGYAGALRYARTLVSAVHAVRGRPPLPAPGAVLRYAALFSAGLDDAGDWPALWRAVCGRAAARGIAWLALARDERDPANAPLRRLLRPREYRTTLYDVAYRDRPHRLEPWDSRLFRPEVGLL